MGYMDGVLGDHSKYFFQLLTGHVLTCVAAPSSEHRPGLGENIP
jgi:hypothetical protein